METKMQIGVVGAGTMGAGIAQLAAQAGHEVLLTDARSEAVAEAMEKLAATMEKLVAKGKRSREEAHALLGRITATTTLGNLEDCGLVVEAIVESKSIKEQVFKELEQIVDEEAILASNTSSLAITAIAAACRRPERVIGLHFFNPAPVMPLVEVVPGMLTAAGLATRCTDLMRSWGKVPVTCKDTPGFIVNRVARPFYGESLRIHEEGIADMPSIDHALKTVGGFRMGPFELMDLIGNDVNFAVTTSVWQAFFYDPRYTPSLTQQRQVESGRLGRKSGHGYYAYGEGASIPQPHVAPETARQIVERVLAMLINEAVDALFLRVASAEDIDLAMTKGVNYPKGLLAWADEKGAAHWLGVLENLQSEYGEDRYRPSPLLRRMARTGEPFLAR